MKKFEDILNIDQLTPEWITEVFRKKGYLHEGSVTSILRKDLKELRSSNVYFLELEYSSNDKAVLPSAEIVVKSFKPDFQYAKEVKDHLKKEVQFYNTIADKMKGLPIPTSYYAYFSEEPIDNLIILNNMLNTHIDGLSLLNKLTKIHFKKAIDTLAAIHAFWWEHPKIEEITDTPKYNKTIFIAFYKTLENFLPQSLELSSGKISREVKELYKKCYSLYPEVLWKRFSQKKNLTLIHGDAHPWQFYYPKDLEKKAILGDWKCWQLSIGAYDLSYMIGMFWNPEVRHNNEKELIEHYHNALVNYGVKNYSYDDCFYDYRMGFINNFYIPLWNTNPDMFRENAVLNFEDLNCMDLLKS